MTTVEVLKQAKTFAIERNINDIVVASTSGSTGVKAANIFDEETFNLVVVGHSTGFSETNEQELTEQHRKKIEAQGGTIFIGPMIFHNINTSIRAKAGFSPHDLVADVLRLFGQGTKVALEDVFMACDAGLIDSGKDVISIAGTGSGADTALLIHASNSKDMFESRIREVLIKPSKLENLPLY